MRMVVGRKGTEVGLLSYGVRDIVARLLCMAEV